MSSSSSPPPSTTSSSDRGAIWTSPPQSDTNFCYVLEDVNIEASIVRHITESRKKLSVSEFDSPSPTGLRLLLPCSAGDSSLFLSSLPFVQSIVAVDIQKPQLYTAELKFAAFRYFSHLSDLINFFSNPPYSPSLKDAVPSLDRVISFRKFHFEKIKVKLSAECQKYWYDSDSVSPSRFDRLLSNGLYSFGFRQEDCVKMCQNLQNKSEGNEDFAFPILYHHDKSISKTDDPLSSSPSTLPTPSISITLNPHFFHSPVHLSHWRSYFNSHMVNIALPNGFVLKGGKNLEKVVTKSLFREWHREEQRRKERETEEKSLAKKSDSPHLNWFIRSFFGLFHPTSPSPLLPPYYSNELPSFLQIFSHKHQDDNGNGKVWMDKMELKFENIISHLQVKSDGLKDSPTSSHYDFVHLSTILDGVSPTQRVELLKYSSDCLSADGYLLCRTGPFDNEINQRDGNGVTKLRVLLEQNGFDVEHRWSDELAEREKTGVYFDVVVARKKKGSQ